MGKNLQDGGWTSGQLALTFLLLVANMDLVALFILSWYKLLHQ